MYCTHTTPILYWCCIICPSLASVNMYNATSSITFSYFSGRSSLSDLKVVRKNTDVCHSLTVPKVFLPNSLQTTFTSITLFNWDSFHFFCFWCSYNACSNNVLNKRFQTVRVRGFPRGFADGYWTIATVSSIKVLYRSMLAINIKII